jgi:hypothetical protein
MLCENALEPTAFKIIASIALCQHHLPAAIGFRNDET